MKNINEAIILTTSLRSHIGKAIEAAGGWLAFDRFMELALYAPGLGYYAHSSRKFGLMPHGVKGGGGDFATAPEMSPHFGRALARQLAQALKASGTNEIWEFGAGSGALAAELLGALGERVAQYNIVDLSGSLRERQQERLQAFAGRVHWLTELPTQMRGVVVGNEVLDAMPVKLLVRLNGIWHERGVGVAPTLVASRTALPPEGAELARGGPSRRSVAPTLDASRTALPPEGAELARGCPSRRSVAPTLVASRTALPPKGAELARGGPSLRSTDSDGPVFCYIDRPTDLRPPFEVEGDHDYLTETHAQAEGFIRTVADRLEAGAVFMLDYGFPEHEYYHPQRSMGTLMCHQNHLADTDALSAVGDKDITAHVNFTGIALAGQEAGLQVLGYTGQGRFLLNCGLLDGLENVSLPERVMVQKLVNEHEMGELFKVIGFAVDKAHNPYSGWQALGFVHGDRMDAL